MRQLNLSVFGGVPYTNHGQLIAPDIEALFFSKPLNYEVKNDFRVP
jgi:hypothetical protein